VQIQSFVPLPVFFVSSGVTRVFVPKKLFRNDSLADNPRRKQKGKVGGVKWCLHIRSVYHVKFSWINTQNWAWEPRRTGLGGVIPRQLRYSSGWTCVHRRLVRDTAGKNRTPHHNTAQHNAAQYSTVCYTVRYCARSVLHLASPWPQDLKKLPNALFEITGKQTQRLLVRACKTCTGQSSKEEYATTVQYSTAQYSTVQHRTVCRPARTALLLLCHTDWL